MVNKKISAFIDIVMMMISIFSFCYFVDLSSGIFSVVSAGDREDTERKQRYLDWLDSFDKNIISENESWSSYTISSQVDGIGCCFISKDGQKCGTSAPENCLDNSPFAEGVLCKDSSFCKKGCCYDESAGIYDKNVLKSDCSNDWVNDPNCNMPAAALGCCVLGSESIFETEGQCKVDSLVRALGDKRIVDWRRKVGEIDCISLGATQKEGACVLAGGDCKFVTESDCLGYNGYFMEGYLCSSPDLKTNCSATRNTMCIDGKDKVYFVDSCGNPGNIYDASRVDDPNYWNKVIESNKICGDKNVDNGNANSRDCGNCDRFAGGICGSAVDDGFNVDIGDYYCRDTSCMWKGERYRNGESWCVYDGAIGEGRDVVGSRHWKYVCSQGVIRVEPCADYRNQICVQTNKLDVNNVSVGFKNAACVANNWRACINLNGEDGMDEKCAETLNCRVDNVNIADKFSFNVCLPKYPAGFSFSDKRYIETAGELCKMASTSCTVLRKGKRWGHGCEYIANEGCMSEKFAQEMNDFCTGLGDCGGSVNIVGDYSENYVVRENGVLTRSRFLSSSWVKKLIEFATPIPGEFAKIENYTEFLVAAGVLEDPGVAEEEKEIIPTNSIGMGLSGITLAAKYIAIPYLSTTVSTAGTTGILGTTTTSLTPFSGALMGAGIGMVAGSMLAKRMGLSSGGSMLMSIGGALVGGVVGFYMIGPGFAAMGPVGWAILIIGVVLMVLASLFGGNKCPPIKVEFECKAWQPPYGGDNCEKCNGDPLKPCSQYRCESLGAGCKLVNVGSKNEMCASEDDDGKPPLVKPLIDGISKNVIYDNVDDSGFKVTSKDGDCLDAYTPLTFGVESDELSYCKFDIEERTFDDLSYDLGSNAYLYNHSVTFNLPDPSHGKSQGLNWTGDLSLFIKCRDVHGVVSKDFYRIDMCVKEGKDISDPRIIKVNPNNNGLVSFNSSKFNFELLTNELATCRWDFNDIDYLKMKNNLICDTSLASPSSPFGYKCTANLSIDEGISNLTYYIRCGDQPWLNESERNFNANSFVYNIRKPEGNIAIDWIRPNKSFEISTAMKTIDLKLKTSKGGDFHFCSYSFSGYDKMIEMFETGNEKVHSQILNLNPGIHKIYFECRDELGDFVRDSIYFEIVRDSSSPSVARIWQDGGFVNLVLNEEGECRFSFDSCKFNWDDGFPIGEGRELRFTVVRGEKYNIRCMDEFKNAPSGCSVVARAL